VKRCSTVSKALAKHSFRPGHGDGDGGMDWGFGLRSREFGPLEMVRAPKPPVGAITPRESHAALGKDNSFYLHYCSAYHNRLFRPAEEGNCAE
jgi:hypothetical protein